MDTTQVDVTARVNYGSDRVVLFPMIKFMAGAMSQEGDSGSAVLDTDNNLLDLRFEGSDTTTLINHPQNGFEARKFLYPKMVITF